MHDRRMDNHIADELSEGATMRDLIVIWDAIRIVFEKEYFFR